MAHPTFKGHQRKITLRALTLAVPLSANGLKICHPPAMVKAAARRRSAAKRIGPKTEESFCAYEPPSIFDHTPIKIWSLNFANGVVLERGTEVEVVLERVSFVPSFFSWLLWCVFLGCFLLCVFLLFLRCVVFQLLFFSPVLVMCHELVFFLVVLVFPGLVGSVCITI